MKRFISFALALMMLFFFVGCDKEEVNYSFKSGEVGFSVHHDADAVIKKLGDPIDLVETPSCGGGAEPDREYTYAGFKFNTVIDKRCPVVNVIERIRVIFRFNNNFHCLA